mmetsp:Transcript_1207/g.1896  ORF Transcript_1207/g.1896 Transcript_1207/m.1896 type:complete len:159 (-) Transcript_1207:74-550(-)
MLLRKLRRQRSENMFLMKRAQRFTEARKTLHEMENEALKAYFAQWISIHTNFNVSPEKFCEDLVSGEALCSLMERIPDSGVKKFHVLENVKSKPMREFLRRDNLVTFQDSCRRLALPVLCNIPLGDPKAEARLISVLLRLEELYEEDDLQPVREAPEL